MNAVTLNTLTMRFKGAPNDALCGITASFPAGQISGLVGPDAAGKTTLMRILAGLMEPSGGQAHVFDGPPAAAAARGDIGYMPQRFGLYEDLSVRDNMALHARLRGLEGPAREALFEKLLAFTSLTPFTERLAGRLSGGMKQKLGIACALLGTPKLLLLDEPGVGVDPQSRRELWRMVQELREGGMTIIWSTAYLEEAERCPHVLMLDAGATLYQGAPAELTARAQGRVYALAPLPDEDAKHTLANWLTKPGVEDALIQGSHVRVVLATNASDTTRAAVTAQGRPIPPRLEDAYMSALGGIVQTPSPFAEQEDEGATRPLDPRQGHDAPGPPSGTDVAAQHQCQASMSEIYTADRIPTCAAAATRQPRQWGGPEGLSPSGGARGSAPPNQNQTPIRIEARGLTRRFGDFVAAKDITFSVRAGQIFGLLGPNGAGKSTTFRMLCGLSRPSAGECFVDGVDLLHAGSLARSRLGYMAQKFSLYQDIPVHANISIMADLYGLSREAQAERIPLLVEALELAPYMRTRTGALPLGQKQRLALVCAALHSPPVLFLDEPTSGVDARTRRDFWKHITAMTRAGTAVLVTTHFMEEAEYCDQIALIYQGRVISAGTPDELKANAPGAHDGDITLEDAFIAYIEHSDTNNGGHAA